MKNHPHELIQLILAKRPDFKPKIAIILGSGSANLADRLEDVIRIPYHSLPNFPVSRVEGHPGQLLLGYLNKVPVICCQGRVHAYEGMREKDFQLFIRILKCLGCESVLMTNATGSLRKDFQPGQLVLIADHINFHPMNPLVGINDDAFGPRFFPMDDAYDKKLRHSLQQTAKRLNISLPEGVYFSVLGPSFETPAEIRAFRILGADVIGMSTVPEVIVARHCGLRVAVISVVTNLASGLSEESITHEGTLHFAEKASHDLGRLLETAIDQLTS
ncbi:purine-nucleoside phosphorylase [Rickettsiella endosymbiont of Dermanyssus gallinae]|uniref:purine-nucleoside phosphorylase n=1 Tax=Rickettsiella endosymbiont of Dermanyssus gallinae TaxID=2856608 RepID=UPI001C527ABB|nr:purine-nucleoside phosphorylase [Rickettsiella endosymbiont of Dermanyssus gallinae]